jgi:hypothetical protein
MNENDTNAMRGSIAPDDVEGHAVTSKHVEGPGTEDVEGHTASVKHIAESEEDVEGHKRALGINSEDDDVEGHGRHL